MSAIRKQYDCNSINQFEANTIVIAYDLKIQLSDKKKLFKKKERDTKYYI